MLTPKIAVCISVLLVLGVTTTPAPALEKGLTEQSIQLAEAKKKGQKAAPSATNACGNNVLDANEICDGSDLGGKDCVGLNKGYTGGSLTCSTNCTLDESSCTK